MCASVTQILMAPAVLEPLLSLQYGCRGLRQSQALQSGAPAETPLRPVTPQTANLGRFSGTGSLAVQETGIAGVQAMATAAIQVVIPPGPKGHAQFPCLLARPGLPFDSCAASAFDTSLLQEHGLRILSDKALVMSGTSK